MEENSSTGNVYKTRLLRCVDWLQKQNNQIEDKPTAESRNDSCSQFISETNVERRFQSSLGDDITVPDGVDEPDMKPKRVPLRRLRKDRLRLDCDWQLCEYVTVNYEAYQKHVKLHSADVHVLDIGEKMEYVCLWDACGFKINDFPVMVRHINYHAYHAKLMAVGHNGKVTLNLQCCKLDSTKRNHIPSFSHDFRCMWIDCEQTFYSIQMFFDHVRHHLNCSETLVCNWAGCGIKFTRRNLLIMHVRSHTNERLIACSHCGRHYASNCKLSDHLKRQNATAAGGWTCTMCGAACGSEYLLREHTRAHVSVHACSFCDMSAPTLTSLAAHVRYRHLPPGPDTRPHRCPHCEYSALTKWDLRKHINRHLSKNTKLKKIKREIESEDECSDEENDYQLMNKKEKVKKKYVCHMCPDDKKIFLKSYNLTLHLMKIHGVQLPFGHSRFRYQISEDGLYRLTTTRYESLECSKKIVDGRGTRNPINNSFDVKIVQTADATEETPVHFEVALKVKNEEEVKVKQAVEITMCDVDEDGNIISSEVIKSDVLYA